MLHLETKVLPKQTQRIILTPKMRQSIHLLQLPAIELRTFLEHQIVENPLLEILEENKIDFFRNKYNKEQEEKDSYRKNIAAKIPSLYNQLISQLNIFSQSGLQRKIGEAIIDNIDKNGYLQASLGEIAQELMVSQKDAEDALSLIQSFYPVGVGARNLSECLMLQLKRAGKHLSLAGRIIEKYLPDLEKKNLGKITKELGVSLDEVKSAFGEISRLEPKPGRPFEKEQGKYIIPDILLYHAGDGYRIEFNNENIPKLYISSYYKELLKNRDTLADTREYLMNKLNQAMWLIKTLGRRQDTIRKVVEYIIKTQKDFLDNGPAFIKSLTLKEIGKAIGASESTISRAVTNKYVQTPNGIFELKTFFNNGLKQANGEIFSNGNLKARIKRVTNDEDAHRPLSDEAITEMLYSEGISIARRTVTKYRKQLKILSSRQRRKR